jgi:hypothetical protein
MFRREGSAAFLVIVDEKSPFDYNSVDQSSSLRDYYNPLKSMEINSQQ